MNSKLDPATSDCEILTLFQVVAIFEDLSDSTTNIIFRMIFDFARECNKVKPFALGKNEENFDRLEAELARMSYE